MTLRLAMWSGPRNISTAMMRAWENRPDTVVVDEPFYACFLKATRYNHPMRAEVLASQPTDWLQVSETLTTAHCDTDVFYQKHMTHHMLPQADLSWTRHLTHCFLIRDPFAVVNSYRQKRQSVSAEDIGILRQWELYREISEITGQEIPVIDAEQVLKDPGHVLSRLCTRLEIPFSTQMLHWPKGRRESDGVWASHWYQSVEQSSGFAPYEKREFTLTTAERHVAKSSLASYHRLREHLLD